MHECTFRMYANASFKRPKVLEVYLTCLYIYASKEGSGEHAHIHRLAWTFDANWCMVELVYFV